MNNPTTPKTHSMIVDFIDDFPAPSHIWTPDISKEQAMAFFSDAMLLTSKRPDYPTIPRFQIKKSMLHPDTLILLRYLASVTHGTIVEFGTYIGGSTTMLAKGAGKKRKMIAVEPGGVHDTQPQIPSNDIWGDLVQTLTEQKVLDRVHLLKTNSRAPGTFDQIKEILDGEKIGLICIDSDGHVEEDFNLYRPLCAPGCVVVLDDYGDGSAEAKSMLINKFVDEAVRSGDFVEFGIFRWATWFGRLAT